MKRLLHCALALSLLALPTLEAAAQAWPSRPIKMIVPFPPGGGTDVVARMIGEKLAERLGQPVVPENRPGATGNIGTEIVAHAPPDGYTLLINITALGMYPLVFQKLPFDPFKDLTMVGTLVETPSVLVVPQDSPIKTLADFVAKAKAAPQPLQYGSGGLGSPPHLAAEHFAILNGIKLQHVVYKGTVPAATDVIGGHLDFGAFSLSGILGLVKGGKLRPLVTLSAKRSALIPDVPTAAESGFPGVDSRLRFILAVPANTPAAIVARLNQELAWALDRPDVRENSLKAGLEPVKSTPQETAAMLAFERDSWGSIVRANNIKFD